MHVIDLYQTYPGRIILTRKDGRVCAWRNVR